MGLNITSGKQKTLARVVLYGVEGIGKTTLASQLDKPIFIDLEGGTNQLDVDRVYASTYQEVLQVLANLKADNMGYKTIVIDTADWLETMIIDHIVNTAGENIKSLGDFGWGAGWNKLESEWKKFLDRLTGVQMDVLILAHAELKKFEQPNEQAAYDRYSLKLSKKGSAILKEYPDALLFTNYKTIVTNNEQGVAKANGQKRMMYTTHHASWDAKNRFGLKDELPLDAKSISMIFGNTPDKPIQKQAAKQLVKTQAAMEKATVQESVKEPEKPATQTPAKEPSTDLSKLENLMELSGVSPDSVMNFLIEQGAYPKGTPITNLSEVTVNKLIAAWDDIKGQFGPAAPAKTALNELETLMKADNISAETLQVEVESQNQGKGSYTEYPEELINKLISGWKYVTNSIKEREQ